MSDCITVKSGIGQGTIVSPLIYINDVVRMMPNVHINMYTDDCILYCSGNNWPNVFNKLQLGLNNFDTWCVRNSMVLNVPKSKCLAIGSRTKLFRIDYEQKLSVSGTVLEYVRTCCYLGMFLDSEMTLTPLLS